MDRQTKFEPGLVRIKDIIRPNGPLPISASSFWAGVRSGRYPAPIRLGPRTTCWRSEDIRALIERGVSDGK